MQTVWASVNSQAQDIHGGRHRCSAGHLLPPLPCTNTDLNLVNPAVGIQTDGPL